MGSFSIPTLLVTANVGSIFEDPSEMLKVWTQEFLSTVTRLDPRFIALHCQEVGGKNYENSMKHVEHFVKLLMSSSELRLFDKIRVFLDEDYSSAENFTALGNLYFIHESVNNVLIWDFKDLNFVPVQGKEIHSGNIEAVVTKEKAKFPQDFFPECKWSRKGFLRTRWSIKDSVFDLVNIHLFHDASNFIAMETYPSVYCKNRRRALEHTLQRFHNDSNGKCPYFVFGDFNFRTDTDGVIKKLTEGLTTTRLQNNKNNDHTKLQYATDDRQLVLTIGKKEFNHLDHQTVFLNPTPVWLKSFDKELEAFENHLTEYPITFPPSYPFEEKITEAKSYMQTRCPAWCDRVLLSHTAKQLVNENEKIEYGLIGLETCMGDHKPVYLKVTLRGDSGTLKCCNHSADAAPYECQCCQSYASIQINIIDMSSSDYNYLTPQKLKNIAPKMIIDSKLLHEPITKDMLSHDPYTPESAESRSPLPEEKIAHHVGDAAKEAPNSNLNMTTQSRASQVSPSQLKSRLENVLKFERKSPRVMTRSASENVEMLKNMTKISKSRDTNNEFFRCRAMSEVQKIKRVRLISTMSNSAANSVLRLQSHHSSSDEDWFEFDEMSSPDDNELDDDDDDDDEDDVTTIKKTDEIFVDSCGSDNSIDRSERVTRLNNKGSDDNDINLRKSQQIESNFDKTKNDENVVTMMKQKRRNCCCVM